MIVKCSECQEDMVTSNKGRPENLPAEIRWVKCPQCERCIEVIGNDIAPKSENLGTVEAINFTQTVTITQYVTIKKNGDKVTRNTYSDPERTILTNTEEMT